MTVSTQTSRADYTGNGVTTSFAVPFYFLDNSHLTVLRTQISTGVVTTLVLTTDYGVTGAGVGSGGAVICTTAPTTDQKLSILRSVPLTQLVHYVPNDPFPAATHEQALDQLTMEVQQVNEIAGRALTLPANTTGVSAALPTPSSNNLIGWNSVATGLQNVDISTIATQVAYGTARYDLFSGTGSQTAFTLTANPGAIANLDVSISGVTQRHGIDFTWVSGTTLTFTSAPPAGTNNVLVRYLLGLPQGTSDSASAAFIASGTGAVTRVAQDKMREALSVKDFGAIGDGVADDRTAIAAAFTAAAGRVVLFSAGTYKVATPYAAPTGSRAYVESGASFVTNTPTGVDFRFEQNQATGTAGSVMKIDWLQEANDTKKLSTFGAFWSAIVYAYAGISKAFGSTDGGAGSPVTSQFTLAVNNGSNADVCAGIDIASVQTNTGSKAVFGRNIIVNASPTITSAKLVGVEIDIEPSTGSSTTSTGTGLVLNAFNYSLGFPAMQVGSVGGGLFNNGIIMGGVSGGTCYTTNTTSVPASLIDTNSAVTYSTDAIVVAYPHSIRWGQNGSSSQAGRFYVDSGNNFNMQHAAGAFISTGNTATEGNQLWDIRGSGGVASVGVYAASGTSGSGTGAALKVKANTSTSRSINAGGTINASGADYAEYETRRDDCGHIAKGQIVGFDADGLLTDRWADAVSFGVKSTSPNLVGGDTWHDKAGPEPIAPMPPASPPTRPEPGVSGRADVQAQMDAEHAERVAAWEKLQEQYASDRAVWEQQQALYVEAKRAYDEALERERQRVDRIAYCGKVPVNVTGARVGNYIVPIESNGKIAAVAVSKPSFAQYQIAVGRVRRILPDGRAEIVVKTI